MRKSGRQNFEIQNSLVLDWLFFSESSRIFSGFEPRSLFYAGNYWSTFNLILREDSAIDGRKNATKKIDNEVKFTLALRYGTDNDRHKNFTLLITNI